ncbi:MAG: 3-hydroxyacyl-CoA dehydrogenase/enoyl-CoA hydratase family protein [Candidatus Thermoplasmatota archaeon]
MRDIRTLAVLGAGDMGHGVAELAALSGIDVWLRDIDAVALDRAMGKVRASLDKLVQRQRATGAQADAAFARIRPTRELAEAVGSADLIIEAVPEKLELKQRVFAEVESAAPPQAVLASNTSAIRIREVGAQLRDPSRLVGMHFFNPVLLMDLIEIIPSPSTSKDAVEAAESFAKKLGKTHVTLREDTPGFVTSRLIGTWVGAAVICFEHKLGGKEEIDSALRFKAGFPMGPFELADYTGLDIGVHAAEYMASRLGDAYKPGPGMRALVDQGLLGKKNGRGYYEWNVGKMLIPITPDVGRSFDPALVLSVVANEAAKLLEQGVADAKDIDLAMRHGCAFPMGPLEWADSVGLDTVLKALYSLEEKTGHPIVKPYEKLVELVEGGKLGKASGQGFYQYGGSATGAAVAAPASGPKFETVLYDLDAAMMVATITLNRPHRLNAINGQLLVDLRAALAAAESDDRARAVIITGSGDKAFCVGADLGDVGGMTPASATALAREGHWMCIGIEKMGKPVIAAVNGHALGGGFELTLPCDFRVAARRATFGLPEVTIGLLPAMGGTQRLPRLVGLSRAKEIALLGNRVDAQKAHELGLVHRVFENDSFERDTRAFAAELASRAPLSMRMTKQLLNSALSTDILMGMEAESTAFGVLASTEDMLEGVSSMFAKKKPEFRGK